MIDLRSLISASLFALSFGAAPASAAVISADFGEILDLPDSFSSGPRTFLDLGRTLGAGPELSIADQTANPSFWRGFVDVDLSTGGLITLSRDLIETAGDYDYALITITNILFDAGEVITGVTSLSSTLMDPSYAYSGGPVISTTANSVSFLWDFAGAGNGADFRFNNGGVANFQLTTVTPAAVPLPASLPLLGAALAGLGLLRRRNRKA